MEDSVIKHTILNTKINLSAFLFTTILVLIFIRFLTLLPEKYYFGFSKTVNPMETQNFFVKPPSINQEKYNEILESNGYNEFTRYEDEIGNSKNIQIDHNARKLKITNQIIEVGQFNFWISLFLKIIPPFLVAYFLFFIWKNDGRLSIQLGASFTAFLMCWPVIMLWDHAVYNVWDKQQYLFSLLYISYILLYYYVAKLGCIISNLTLEFGFVKKGKIEINWGTIISNLFSTGVTATVTWIITMAIAKA